VPKTRYGISPWIHQFPRSRRPDFPRFRGELSADVVVIGGGLTGCATAFALASAGLKPLLLEQDRVGCGNAGRGAGLLRPDPVASFRDLADTHGLRAARHAFETWREAVRDAAALVRRLGIRCGLEPLDLLVVAEREHEKTLRRDYESRAAAGLEIAWLAQKPIEKSTKLAAPGALRMRDGYSLDPYRACVGLAVLAAKRRAHIFERSGVKKVRGGRKFVDLVLEGGTIRATTVIVATGSATDRYGPLRRHFARREAYLALTEPVPAAMRRQLGDPSVAIQDTRVPPRRVRWTADGRLLLAGGDQDETPARTREGVIVQRTGDLMYGLLTMYPAISGLQPEYGWEASYGETADGLMYIGPHRNYPRHLFALGGTPDSVTGAFLSARMLLRAVQGTAEKSDAVFGFAR
jgi:glycine/D-amino acid oxidase-like deaminating enzyme